ncbi:MAG: UDP-N-acetylmuramate--L-alanine ligase [Candidatus Omnitrophica bacterium]|nr:UDP-N-acetylmuramate--L-alanine ligase [Candidatus Omnitrophota bacterium]MDE2221875.1 UDP-N-acetylmuramate--L-alanine ligase [Candidatus Omnitrophota bacterium]
MSKHYHLIGIGGIGMGTLASLLLDQGHTISGSDVKDNEMTSGLRKKGVTVAIGHSAGNIAKTVDYVVYSSAIRVTNPELFEAHSRNLPVLQRAQVLAQLANQQLPITIAGAHGKTTTTSMVSSLLINAGLKPTTAIGGIINGTTAYNANLGEGKYFVAEVDESDGTFLYFNPQYSIITNMDFEHVDFYKNWDGITQAYGRFISGTRPQGCLIVCGEDKRLTELARGQKAGLITYGLSSDYDVFATDMVSDGFQSSFCAHARQAPVGAFELNVPGRHNILNALACISLGLELGVPYEVMFRTLKNFTGVKRRFQLKGKADGIMVIDDYGHHPTEIAATLNAARLFAPKRLITVFQPHRYSRTKFLLNEFAAALGLTDELVLTDVYAASEKIGEGVGTGALLEKLQGALGERVIYLKKEDIVKHVQDHVRPGDLVIFLGAGDIYHLSDELVKNLETPRKAGAVERVL